MITMMMTHGMAVMYNNMGSHGAGAAKIGVVDRARLRSLKESSARYNQTK
jgi:hypothetical protein